MVQKYTHIDADRVRISEPHTPNSTPRRKSHNPSSSVASSPSLSRTPRASSPPISPSPSPIKRATYSDDPVTDIVSSTKKTYPPPVTPARKSGYEAIRDANDAAVTLLSLRKVFVKGHPSLCHNSLFSATDSGAPSCTRKSLSKKSNTSTVRTIKSIKKSTKSTSVYTSNADEEDSDEEPDQLSVLVESESGWNIAKWASIQAAHAAAGTFIQREPSLTPTEIYGESDSESGTDDCDSLVQDELEVSDGEESETE